MKVFEIVVFVVWAEPSSSTISLMKFLLCLTEQTLWKKEEFSSPSLIHNFFALWYHNWASWREIWLRSFFRESLRLLLLGVKLKSLSFLSMKSASWIIASFVVLKEFSLSFYHGLMKFARDLSLCMKEKPGNSVCLESSHHLSIFLLKSGSFMTFEFNLNGEGSQLRILSSHTKGKWSKVVRGRVLVVWVTKVSSQLGL